MKKYVTVISNAKNTPQLRLSLAATIRPELGIEPGYLSLQPDREGKVSQTLTITTMKKDLGIESVTFKEQEKLGEKGENWRASLPLHFKHDLKPGKLLPDGYTEYKLDISLQVPEGGLLSGDFVFKTNHPKKKEATLTGVILEKKEADPAGSGQDTGKAQAPQK